MFLNRIIQIPSIRDTKINFSILEASKVKLIIADILGREIAVIVNDNLNAGNYAVNFNTSGLSEFSSGVYFYTLITDNFKQSKKMILMK